MSLEFLTTILASTAAALGLLDLVKSLLAPRFRNLLDWIIHKYVHFLKKTSDHDEFRAAQTAGGKVEIHLKLPSGEIKIIRLDPKNEGSIRRFIAETGERSDE